MQQQNATHGIMKKYPDSLNGNRWFSLLHSRWNILVSNMKSMSQQSKNIFKHVAVMVASVGWRMGVVEVTGITDNMFLEMLKGENWLHQNDKTALCSEATRDSCSWGRTNREMRLTPPWAVMEHSPEGHGHGGRSLMGPSTFPDQATIEPDPEFTSGLPSGGNRSRARTRAGHKATTWCKVHPGEKDKNRTGDKQQSSPVLI